MSSSLQPDFESLPQTQKGKVGEQLVDLHLFERGIIPYGPVFGAAHPFDRLCASRDKRDLFVVEVKSKARRTYYPDTGVNIAHYEGYMHIKATYQIPVFLYFVDEMLKKVYGGELAFLTRPTIIPHKGKVLKYPLRSNGIIYFPLVNMTTLAELDEVSAQRLKALSTRKYAYKVAG